MALLTAIAVLGGLVVAFYLYARFYRYKETVVGARYRTDVPVASDAEPLLGHNRSVRRQVLRRLERQVEMMKKHGE